MSAVEGKMEEFLPTIRCGFYYPDRWVSPYLGVDFALPTGQPVLEFAVFNPKNAEFLGASFLVRLGLIALYRSAPMQPDTYQRHSIELPAMHEAATISISFRSSVRWRAPDPDERVLGLVLPLLYCSVRSG